MAKILRNLVIVVCLLFTTVSVHAQTGDEPPPPQDGSGLVMQDGGLTANPLPLAEQPVVQGSTQIAGQGAGTTNPSSPESAPLPQSQEPPSFARPSWSGEQLPLQPGELEQILNSPADSPIVLLGGGDPCKPSHLVNINFDEKSQPGLFANAVALRNEYRAQGIVFWGDAAKTGGAVLNDSTITSYVTGYSAPNMLVFSTIAPLSDGAMPKPPETIGIMGKASYVQMKVSSFPGQGVGTTLYATARGEDNTLLASTSIVLTASMQTIALSHTGITFINLNTSAVNLLVDDISYLPETIAQVINFDDAVQPGSFISANPLRSAYSDRGVTFSGPSALDGGAILDESSLFSVTGYSPPNFLAFNQDLTMANGGVPRFPEQISFNMPVSLVQIYPASNSGAGSSISMTAYDKFGNVKGSASLTLAPKIQMLTVTGYSITRVVINSTVHLIIDDLIYRPENAVHADFDDSLTAPSVFVETTPLRDEMKSCGVSFRGGTANDGGALLNDSTFSTKSLSSPNFLAFNSILSYVGGGIPRMPEYLNFDPPATYVEFYAGAASGYTGSLGITAYDDNYGVVSSKTIDLTTSYKPVRLTGNRPISRVLINSTIQVLMIDNLFYTRSNWQSYLPITRK